MSTPADLRCHDAYAGDQRLALRARRFIAAVADQDKLPYLCQHCHGAPRHGDNLAERRSRPSIGKPAGRGRQFHMAAVPSQGLQSLSRHRRQGYAFLKPPSRTGSPLWLERARAFGMTAMHSVEKRALSSDVALFAMDRRYRTCRVSWDCLKAEPVFRQVDTSFRSTSAASSSEAAIAVALTLCAAALGGVRR